LSNRLNEFRVLGAIEKAATNAALDRCRGLADWIVSELDGKAEPFHDLATVADFLTSLDDASNVLKDKRRRRLKPYQLEDRQIDISRKQLSAATKKIDRSAAMVAKRAAKLASLAQQYG
jgi:hypothetical protein